ncbi:MAG TPA: hypothetical protein PLB89_01070 [Flavobacteriales bacterium]|nr:hypothetical protein [Flavobacteriales bacterium]
MSALDLQAEIMQLLREERNMSILEAIRMLLLRDEGEVDDDFTAEELAELDAQRADHLSGKSKSFTAEESIRMIREGFKG